jgi:hypothetical protein
MRVFCNRFLLIIEVIRQYRKDRSMKKITWDDLIINMIDVDVKKVYEDWLWLLNGKLQPLMITKFGDLFFKREDGKVYFLDTIEGKIVDICSSENEFSKFINLKDNIENYLLSYIIVDLINQDKIPQRYECYSFIKPPILGGKIEYDNVNVMSLAVNVSIAGQIHRQLENMPEGTTVSEFKISN